MMVERQDKTEKEGEKCMLQEVGIFRGYKEVQ